MVNSSDLITRDLRHIWHPCAQMKDFERVAPLVIERASGSLLYTPDGALIDSISSWWCKSLGHGHPAILAAIRAQLERFEHVIAANTTHENLARLGEKLAALSGLQHVLFASDGSSAVEISLKLALMYQRHRGEHQRTRFMALSGAYHGETLGALSVSRAEAFRIGEHQPGFACDFLSPLPFVSGTDDPLWKDCEHVWPYIESQLLAAKDTLAAIIVEPLIQGAIGMRCYSADFLRRLSMFAREHGILLIADEIMTGIGRTGTWLACEHAGIRADMVCLSKGLTAGALPLSCTLVNTGIYQEFYADAASGKAFLHSHTHSANALAVAAALATLETFESEGILARAASLGHTLREHFLTVANDSDALENVRSLGAMVAADIKAPAHARAGFTLAHEAQRRGALLRPIGNTLYWLPPLTMDSSTVEKLAEITLHSLHACKKRDWTI
ncbi:adenosylmethionine-8-amino-7-oxononanoate aminotransferase [Legionella geestiana]|uniref:Adenosylmethionine-8-amino-7-oxononanoate aminotransferase n=1 Tax=Legionella geestiana TaxID=45065 RepID=A0A0W0TPD2_9GAMM|nr:adenosylmethionine--8-amino-7-oxononanoate transaminase [Legionella geestiana]KTC97420.1 adenosylmethionine-8-amino-7-oxononanoate aminotransferase [Legionella geestiana]QBS11273.1 adenosylmethionine--8-amino-7-oxononanoate transaminase [Legionella geestiana]STX54097.1 adenosylmethionine-8-amino-7-oxononanoate aminotransferase [Legionella geestiana]